MKPEVPDWIIEGMRLVEHHEVLQARARAAWRRGIARDAMQYSVKANEVPVFLNSLYQWLERSRTAVRHYKKAIS